MELLKTIDHRDEELINQSSGNLQFVDLLHRFWLDFFSGGSCMDDKEGTEKNTPCLVEISRNLMKLMDDP